MTQGLIFKINSLRKRAERFQSLVMKNEDIFKEDITELLEKEVRYQIRNGEIVIIEVKGKPRTGKSTAGIIITKDWIDDELKKSGRKSKDLKFGMRNIARDEQEYSTKMRNEKLMNDVILTDEQNELEKGGENATTEQQVRSVFSDVQAGRYVHRVSVSPSEVIDGNSDIWIETVGVDSKLMLTHCRVYYRINTAQTEFWQPIGYINIHVGDLINSWEKKVKKIFLKTKRSEKDKKFIEKWSKNDFYVLYMVKKYQKMDLITKYNILRPRELPYAKVILKVIAQLKGMTQFMILDTSMIQSYTEIAMREEGLVGSIIGKRRTAERAKAIIDIYKGIYKNRKKEELELNKKENAGRKKEIKIIYSQVYDILQEGIDKQIKEYELYIRVHEEYLTDVK